MGTKHPHYDVIVAWAAGEEVEYRSMHTKGEWIGIPKGDTPQFNSNTDYRIKPKRVKKEGWVNVFEGPWFVVHTNEERAHLDKSAVSKKLACIRIEWEEEQ